MIVQIYTMQTPEEALACVAAGVDHLGTTPSTRGLPGEISVETTKAIFAAVGSRAVKIALTVDTDPAVIVPMARAVMPDVLHLCPLRGAFLPDAVAALREQLPGVKIMQAISVGGPDTLDQAVGDALAYAPVSDYLILDTQAPHIEGIGASGVAHDWSVSRRIVESVRIPVILAGGLSPANVGAAMRAVRPYGVDSLTHTNQPIPGGFRKDIEKVRAFVQSVRAASAEIPS
ncbi:MAG: phosphoribosylanthranilate isomerase [Anaerolineae bacterium]